jgi:NTE family protein
MNLISNMLSIFKWLFVRLPLGFSIPFTAASLWWVLSGFRRLNDAVANLAATEVVHQLQSELPCHIGQVLTANLGAFFYGAIVVALFSLGFLVAYNASALINGILLWANLKPIRFATGSPWTPTPLVSPSQDPFANVQKIGIVLAGGGAKGAFQAGSMKAIYQFLADHNALRKVKVISGTSIGSWNALFWLADLILSSQGGASVHKLWWKSISVKALAAPIWYIPFARNAFLSSEPWRRVFDHIFLQPDVRKRILESDIHFYLTRSNVQSGQLTCATNNPRPPAIAKITYDILNVDDGAERFLNGLKVGVFASMDFPPLFPYVRDRGGLFEDGGVIDNVPIIFPANDGCDLIFILPLNADFEQAPNNTSIVARLFRVMNVRQGVLERNGFKMIYLYNELAALREYVDSLQALTPSARSPGSASLAFALARRNRPIAVFAVCPQKSFVRETLNTQELWKNKQAGTAFDVMDHATKSILTEFKFERRQEAIRVALVGKEGGVVWDENF